MKTKIALLFLAGIFFSCQQKQHFSSSPEIDLFKKLEESYFNRDFATYRSFFHDTASVYLNNWFHEKLTPDQFLEILKNGAEQITESHFAKNGSYEMVVTDEGHHWVHVWTEWTQMRKSGKEVRIPMHFAVRVENNKIIFFGAVYDGLPGYLAEQAIQKGTFMSMHTLQVTLKPGVTLDQYVDFYQTKILAGYEKITPGLKAFLMSAIRGEGKGSLGILWTFQSEKDRDQYFNDNGTPTEAGKAWLQKLQPEMDELNKLGSSKLKWTDWVVQ